MTAVMAVLQNYADMAFDQRHGGENIEALEVESACLAGKATDCENAVCNLTGTAQRVPTWRLPRESLERQVARTGEMVNRPMRVCTDVLCIDKYCVYMRETTAMADAVMHFSAVPAFIGPLQELNVFGDPVDGTSDTELIPQPPKRQGVL